MKTPATGFSEREFAAIGEFLCSEKFKVQSSKFKVERMERASVPAKVGCVPRTINICHLS